MSPSLPPRSLGLDVGSVRIGVALSDPLGMTAQPLEVIDRRHGNLVATLRALVEAHDVQTVVVGLPLTLEGTSGPAAQKIEQWVSDVRKSLPETLRWTFWDERLSTAQVERVMIEGGARRKTRRKAIDKLAAAVILQSYLDARATDRSPTD